MRFSSLDLARDCLCYRKNDFYNTYYIYKTRTEIFSRQDEFDNKN